MIVVAIIALLAAIAIPNFLRARKRSQATRIIQDLRMLDGALDLYAMEHSKAPGIGVAFDDLKHYIKTNSVLYSGTGTDLFGNAYGPFTIDSIPKVPDSTFDMLSDVADATFWSPYK